MEDQKEAWRRYMYYRLWLEQQEYEEYWVRNSWGFGDKMRDYLLEGNRRIPYGK